MSIEDNINGYNQWSAFYDTYVNPTVAIDELTFPEVYSSKIGRKVLEIGCGTGRHTQRLVQMGCQVTAIDVSSGMPAQARKKIKSELLTLIEGDFLTTEISYGPFDGVVMSLVLEHIHSLKPFFEKTKRLLKPNGSLCFSEIQPDRSVKGIGAHFKTTNGEEQLLSSFPHAEKEIAKAANECGFVVESCKTISGTREFIQKNKKWEKYLHKPMLQIWMLRALA